MAIDVTSLSDAYEFLPDPTGIVDETGKLLFINTAFAQLIGDNQKSQSMEALDEVFLLRQTSANSWQNALSKALSEICTLDVLIAAKSKHLVSCSLHLSPIVDEGRFVCFLARLSNKSVDALPDQSLTTLAYRDSLTGLANRYLFSQLFDHEISQSQRLAKRFAVLFMDLDKFKLVNDNMGHDAGDALLCAVAERLQKSLRRSDLIARMGGDEFAVIMSNIKDTETISKVCEKLIREVKKPVRSGNNVMEVGCSIGISIYPDNGETAESLLQQGDAAMYRAKHDGGNRYQFFSEALNQELNDIRVVEQELQQGLIDDQFVPYFQPVFDLRDNRIVGVECLARWQHPKRGVLAATEFINVAEKKGLIIDVFEQVLTKAFEQIDDWTMSLNERIPLSINVSNRQFYQHKTFDLIDNLIKKHQVPADAIRIEVTESTLQESESDLLEHLTRIKTSGFSITLDDFGTGYSSLRYLQQLPVDTLKIDRSFVRNLENNPQEKIIVKAIIQLAETLGISVVAEGVETAVQSEFLAQNACFIMQGYLFSQPLSSQDFEVFMKTKSSLT
ncbi:EAL domain-containing protein [Aliiglaciecola sp. 3_MG-2023]|uniref:sensor domain-containing protein n=1 Tax=Aliiglaciecola sp. 3_MG-2023 TaxID=3062644 RepID=UPI0026E42DFD|nr:GGDEF and EAL domain-containing protein [Aliiglaciecola sp. 3_MG-2023]MDO6693592.1 EAL domain-containing protein [Aliiglaciecola sp. 3_MG-2023]